MKPTNDHEKATGKPLGVFSWCLYDWANSAFGTIITTFIFAPYFVSAVAETSMRGTALWGYTASIAALIVAVVSPIFGAVADKTGPRKPWLVFFTGACVLLTCTLYAVRPTPDHTLFALVIFGGATIAADLAWVFNNSMLPTLVSRDKVGRVSGWAWSLGYLGGVVSLVTALYFFVREGSPLSYFDSGELEHIRATAVLTGVWYGLFALPLIFFTPDRKSQGIGLKAGVASGLQTLVATVRQARQYANILYFLTAYLFWANGLTTLFAFAGIYAVGTFGMDMTEVTLFAIWLNVTAGAGALGFSWVDDWLGPKKTIAIALLGLIALGTVLVLTESKTVLWAAGLPFGAFIGPAQSASRSFMARLVPKSMETEMFGLYALSGKATAFAGPFVLALVTQVFESQRAGMASILAFFIVGLILLQLVQEPSKEAPDAVR